MSNEVLSYIVNNLNYFPWFKVKFSIFKNNTIFSYSIACIGAVDDTHVSVWVLVDRQTSFKGRKIVITQNVMCACDFNIMFTFVYVGWEGITNNALVLLDALTRLEIQFPWSIERKYYLVYLGYPCTFEFLHTIIS